jgi:hypothetical protein
MSLRSRIALIATLLVLAAIAVNTLLQTFAARRAVLHQAQDGGDSIAEAVARVAAFAEEVPRQVEEEIGQQMEAQARLLAHLVNRDDVRVNQPRGEFRFADKPSSEWHRHEGFRPGNLERDPPAEKLVAGLERERRGVYAGAVGYVGFTGEMDTAIAIRTLVVRGSAVHLQAGAGIVFDSDPASEYDETIVKLGATMRAVDAAVEAAERRAAAAAAAAAAAGAAAGEKGR